MSALPESHVLASRRPAAWLAGLLDELLDDRHPTFANIMAVLQRGRPEYASEVAPDVRAFGTALELLLQGRTLCATARWRSDSWGNEDLVVERVCALDDRFEKVTLVLASRELPTPTDARVALGDGPSLVLVSSPITVADMDQEWALGPMHWQLADAEIEEFFLNKDAILDAQAQARGLTDPRHAARLRAWIARDRDHIRAAFEAVTSGCAAQGADTGGDEGPWIQVLPRLVRPPAGQSILALLRRRLPALHDAGYRGLLLGVVDHQSIDLFFGESSEDGRLTPYVNNHGYWSSGEAGIDRALGTEAEYAGLVADCHALGMSFVQDAIVGSLGYPAQLRRLAASRLQAPTTCVALGGGERPVWDQTTFLHEICIADEDSLTERVTPDHYAFVLSQSHIGSPFALPKPNLFAEDVRDAALARALWQVAAADVRSFRIDMAKHIGAEPLRDILRKLRAAVAQRTGRTDAFSATLEYWTTNYRDLAIAWQLVGEERHGVRLFDFPLAQGLQEVFAAGKPLRATLEHVLAQRARWGVSGAMLQPTFIDHDFNFRPYYNGSASSRDTVIAGYALCAMLSAHAPCVYFGFDDPRAGPATGVDYFDTSERQSRRVVDEVPRSPESSSPTAGVLAVLRMLRESGLFEASSPGTAELAPVASCEDAIAVARRVPATVGRPAATLTLSVARSTPLPSPSAPARRLFSCGEGPFVALDVIFGELT